MRSSFNQFRGALRAMTVAAALLLPACSDGPTQTGSVEILHWWKQGGEAEAIGKLLALFKEKHPTVKIIDSSVDGSKLARGAIENKIKMGSPPGTFQANGGSDLMSWVIFGGSKTAEQSKMQALDPAMLDWIDKVPEPVLQSVSYNGTVYAVPLNVHRLNALFYNKDVFARAGIFVGDLTDLAQVFVAAEKVRLYNMQNPEQPPIAPISLGFRATAGEMASDDTWTLSLVFFENILLGRLQAQRFQNFFKLPGMDGAFGEAVTGAVGDFRRLVSYSNLDAPSLTWSAALDMVLDGRAAMTIMGDWGKGYANARNVFDDTFGVIPTPGTTGMFAFTTDTFGLPIGAPDPEATLRLLEVFGSREGQDVFNPIKGSISVRLDSDIANGNYDQMAMQTFKDFREGVAVPGTSILAPPFYVDAMSAALADFARARENGNPSIVQHTLDNYMDALQDSCWPTCRPDPRAPDPAP